MTVTRAGRLVCCWLVACFLSAPAVAVPPVGDGAARPVVRQWQLEAAERALESGLAGLAVRQYRSLLGSAAGLSEAQLESLRYGLVAALIAQGQPAEAEVALQAINESQTDRFRLYRALIDFMPGAPESDYDWQGALGSIEASALGADELPWFHFLKGAAASLEGREEAAAEYFEAAKAAALSAEQAAYFESLILRQQMFASEAPDEKLLADVRKRLDELSGEPAAYPFLKEYVLLLHRMDRSGEAVAALDAAVAAERSAYSGEERAQLNLLRGMLLGADTPAGRGVLQEMVRRGEGRTAMAIALQLLIRTMSEPTDMLTFLSQVIAQMPDHPLIVQLYYLRAQLALANPQTAAVAEADARLLLEQYPGARELGDVYSLLAYAALQRQPPQFRAAAEYLIRQRETAESPGERFRINRMIGDCYFLNGDFENAVDFYRIAEREQIGRPSGESIFLRLAVAELRAGRVEQAIAFVDQADFSGVIRQSDRWMAEWNIAQALIREGSLARARARVAALLDAAGEEPVPATLDLRLRWLSLHLQLLAGESETLAAEAEKLLRRVEGMVASASGDELDLMKAEIMLLSGKSLLAQQEREAGFAVLRDLRAAFPDSGAAQRTFMAEASFHAAAGDFRAAQSTLVALVDAYPLSDLAPQALFEAAVHCERRGAAHYGEAIVLLDRLSENYPAAPIVFHAGLKQGDLLRSMNDFASAQLLYENLINRYPEHPLRHVAELAQADCLVALAADDPAELADAAAVLERLLDLPGLSPALQAEVAHKLGLVLQRRGAEAAAEEVFTLMTARYLLNPDRVLELGELGQYWLSRSAFELGSSLEAKGAGEEARRLYRKMIAFNLPGRSIAADRLSAMEATGAL